MSGKKGGGHGRVSGLMTGQTGPGKTGTSMHGLSTASPRKKIGGCQKRRSTRQQPNLRKLCAKTEAGQNEGAKPTQK